MAARLSFVNVRVALAEESAERISYTENKALGFAELIVHWPDCPEGDQGKAQTFLSRYVSVKNTKHSTYVDDPMARTGGDPEVYPGKWRLVENSADIRARGIMGPIRTLRRGFYQGLDWTEARIEDGRETEGNTEAVSGVANTTGDSPRKHMWVVFPNINPEYTQAIVDSIGATITAPVVQKKTYTGDWHRTAIKTREVSDDGCHEIRILLCRPTFTISGYEDFGGTKAADVVYLYGIPEELADDIVLAHKTGVGKGARVGKPNEEGLVDIVLRAATVTGTTLTSPSVPLACDTAAVYHWGWGLPATATLPAVSVESFIDDHNGALSAGVTRKVHVSDHGDGLFDVEIIETTVTYDADKHLYQLDLAIGDRIVHQKNWGYSCSITTLEGLQAAYENQEVNVRKEFQILRRHDNCTFDYVGEVWTYNVQSATIETTGTGGLQVAVTRKRFDTSAPSTSTAAKRKRFNLDIEENEVGSNDWKKTETTLVEVADQSTETTGSTGIGYKLRFGTNQDAAPSITKAARKRIRGSVNAKDGGEIDHFLFEETIVETAGTTKGGSGTGIVEEIGLYGHADPGNVTIPASTRLKRVVPSLGAEDDGTFSGNYRAVTRVETDGGALTITAADGIVHNFYFGRNAAADPVITTGKRQRLNGSIRADDDGNKEWAFHKQTLPASKETLTGGTIGEAHEVTVGDHRDAFPAVATPTARGISQLIELAGFDETGAARFRIDKRTKQEISASTTGGSSTRTIVNTNVQGDKDLDDLDESGTVAQGVSVFFRLVQRRDGSTDWEKSQITSVETNATYTLAKLKPGWLQGGYTKSATQFKYKRTLPTFAGDYGYFESIAIMDDGTYDGIMVDVTYDEEAFFSSFTNVASYHLIRRHRYGEGRYTDVTYTIKDAFFDGSGGHANAQAHVNGGYWVSGIEPVSLVSIGGKHYWLGRKVSAISA